MNSNQNAILPLPAWQAAIEMKDASKKTVHFFSLTLAHNAVHPVDPALWYRMEDLAGFRVEARDLCFQILCLEEAAAGVATKPGAPRLPALARDVYTRGLEHKTCSERQRRKCLANRFILKASKKLKHDPVKLASVAHKCTRWATELAIEEAARDYYCAWRATKDERVFRDDGVLGRNDTRKRTLYMDSASLQKRQRSEGLTPASAGRICT
jgi:hypothetical protein